MIGVAHYGGDEVKEQRNFGGLSAAVKGNNVKVNQSGVESGLKVVLKAMRMDYCGNLRKWYGAGYHTAIHQQSNILPLHFLSNFPIKFHAGYFYHIGFRVTNMIRHTEHLHRCTSKSLMLGSHSSEISFDRPICLVTCLFKLVYQKCHCFTRVFESLEALITSQNMNLAKINMSTPLCRSTHQMDFCDLTQIMQWRQDEFQLNNCTNCLPHCAESQYATTITETKINNWFISTNRALRNATVDDLIVANFYLESMSVKYIYEDQAFTLEGLAETTSTKMAGNKAACAKTMALNWRHQNIRKGFSTSHFYASHFGTDRLFASRCRKRNNSTCELMLKHAQKGHTSKQLQNYSTVKYGLCSHQTLGVGIAEATVLQQQQNKSFFDLIKIVETINPRGVWHYKDIEQYDAVVLLPHWGHKGLAPQRKDYYEIVNEYIPSIDEQFAYCEMNRKNLGCGDIFGGHLTDIGLCMTFNMIHSEAINTQVDSIECHKILDEIKVCGYFEKVQNNETLKKEQAD
uniref:Uncharacterized protein n=1 Tax=Romanomermis culicivorax TaxID=13658 RepID=A0A915I8V3_ROMCU